MTHISTPTVGSLMTLGTIEPTQFEVYAQVDNTGGENVSERGFAYFQGSAGDPTTADSTVFQSGSFGVQGWSDFITGLTTNTSYQVRAYAINSAGTGYSATITVTTAFLLPPTVTNMVATATGMTTASLSWDPDPSHAADSYDVRRERWDGSAWVDLTTIATGLLSPSYGDTGLTPGGLYRWSARGINSEGVGPWSNWDEAQTDVQNGTIEDVGLVPSDFAEGGVFNPWAELAQFTGVLVETYEDTTIALGSTYRYRVSQAEAGVPVGAFTAWKIVYTQLFGPIEDVVPSSQDSLITRVYPIIQDVAPSASDEMPGLIKRPAVTPVLIVPEAGAPSDGRHFAWDYDTNNFVEQEAVAFRRSQIDEGLYNFGATLDEQWLPDVTEFSLGGAEQSPDGSLIAVSVTPPSDGSEPNLRVVFLDAGTRSIVFKWYSTHINGTAGKFSADGNWFSRAASREGILNLNNFSVVDLNRMRPSQQSKVAFSPDSSQFAMWAGTETSQFDTNILIYAVGTWNITDTVADPPGAGGTNCDMSWSPNGSWLGYGHTLADPLDPLEPGGTQPAFTVFATSNWSIEFQTADYSTPNNEYLSPSHLTFSPGNQLIVCLNEGLGTANRKLLRYDSGGSWALQQEINLDVSPRKVDFSNDGNYVMWPAFSNDVTVRSTSDWTTVTRLITVGLVHNSIFIEGNQTAPQGIFIGRNDTGSGRIGRLLEAPTAKTVVAEEWWDGSAWLGSEVWLTMGQGFLFPPLTAWTDPIYYWSVRTREEATDLESAYASNRLFRLDQTYALVVALYGFDAGLMPSDYVVGDLEESAEPAVGSIADAATLPDDNAFGSMLVQGDIDDVAPLDPDQGIFAVPPTLVAPAENALVDGALDVDFIWQFNTDNADTQAEYALWVEGEGWWNGSMFVENQVWVVSGVETVTIPPSAWSESP